VEFLSGRERSGKKKPPPFTPERARSAVAQTAPHEHGVPGSLEEFRQFRERMNAEILGEGNLVINRFFALDTRTYEAGALDVKTKELLGLVASLVLRCDDCVTYHLTRCAEEHVTRAELFESLSVGLVVGGSIVIPHLRRAVDRWSELERIAR
jgi:AhpD family alkylhydroperoxidase